jgi:hypothetical protein
MDHRELWLCHLVEATDTRHWKRGCTGEPSLTRLIPLGWDWQQEERLTVHPPADVIKRALELVSAPVCVDYMPKAVLDHFGTEIRRGTATAAGDRVLPRV